MTSQRWMFTSPGGEDEYKKSSVSREHCDAVFEAIAREKSAETENERKRREFECKTWKLMAEKVLERYESQLQQLVENVDYGSTTYGDTYVRPRFQVKELGSDIDEKLIEKYPLYTDTANSIWAKHTYDKTKAKEPIHKPQASMFRRDTYFTSRLSNPMDRHGSVGLGHFAYI